MKLKIKITGPNVHDVGYRVFLGKLAMSLGIPGFMAYNWNDDGQQQVIALAEGDETRMAIFKKRIEERKPELAVVSAITSEEYDGDVSRTSEFAMLLSFEQFDKAIPILLSMNQTLVGMNQTLGDMNKNLGGKMDQMLEIQGQTVEEIKGLRTDMASQHKDIKMIKSKVGLRR
jgi:acylphosphatase